MTEQTKQERLAAIRGVVLAAMGEHATEPLVSNLVERLAALQPEAGDGEPVGCVYTPHGKTETVRLVTCPEGVMAVEPHEIYDAGAESQCALCGDEKVWDLYDDFDGMRSLAVCDTCLRRLHESALAWAAVNRARSRFVDRARPKNGEGGGARTCTDCGGWWKPNALETPQVGCPWCFIRAQGVDVTPWVG